MDKTNGAKKTGSCLGKVHFTYENGAVFVNFWVKRFSQVSTFLKEQTLGVLIIGFSENCLI